MSQKGSFKVLVSSVQQLNTRAWGSYSDLAFLDRSWDLLHAGVVFGHRGRTVKTRVCLFMVRARE